MRRLLMFFTALTFLTSLAFAGNYSVDKTHTSVGFSVTHMVITDVDGKFKDFEVDLTFDPENLASFNVVATIQIASVDTENQKRDDHLRSPDFFDATTHPTMVFKSSKLEKTDKGYIAHGTLTIRGVTKDVKLAFEVKGPIKGPWGNTRIGIKGTTVIDRQDFGVKWSKVMDGGGFVVSDEVEITIAGQFIKNK